MTLKTMLAAAAVTIGMLAHGEVTLPNGTSFEGLTAGASVGKAELDAAETAGAVWTVPTNLTVTAYATGGETPITGDARPAQFTTAGQENYLGIKTTLGDYVSRALPESVSVTDGFYVDTLVKFTAADEDIEVPSDAKIGVWIKTNEDETENYLMVSAGPVVDNKATIYNCGSVSDVDAWKRLTIKALYNTTDDKLAFVVFVDGAAIGCDEAKTAFQGQTLTPNAQKFATNGNLFPSIVDSDLLSEIAISGQGGIDDISFTDVAPSFAEDYEFITVEYSMAKIDKLYIGDPEGDYQTFTASPASVEKADGLKYWYDAKDGFISLPASAAVDLEKDITIDDPAAAAFAVGTTDYATWAEAVAAASTEDAVITLKADYTMNELDLAASINNVNGVTTIDLNGKTLTGCVNFETELTIVDNGVTGKIVPAEEGDGNVIVCMVEEDAPSLTIVEGTFDGALALTDYPVIIGGKFYEETKSVDGFPYTETNPWTVEDKTYEAVWSDVDNYWTVQEVVATEAEVTIDAGDNLTLTVVDGDGKTINSKDKVAVDTVLTITAVADTDYELKTLTVNGADFTSGNTYTVKAEDVEGGVEIAATAEAIPYVAQVGTTKFETAAAALAKVQELEQNPDNFPIVVKALVDDLQVTDGGSQTITLAKDETITITADGWEFSGELKGTVTLAPGKSIKVKGTTEGISVPAGYGLKATPDGDYTVYTAFLAAAEIDGKMFETIPAALEAAEDGETVTFLTDVAYENKLAKQTTKAAVVDFNGHAVAIDGAIVCTADTDFVIKNGDYVQPKAGSSATDATYLFAVKAGYDLTFTNMIFHGTVGVIKGGAARDVTIVDCTFKDDLQNNGNPRAESGNSFVSYCVNLYANCCGRCFLVGNKFYQKRRASIATDGSDNVVYVYDNDFYGLRNNNTDSELAYRFPTIQGNDFAEIYYENNRLHGEFLQSCVAVYMTDSKLVVRGNTFDSTQNYIWTMKNNGITPTVYFGGNVYENPNINKTRGIYKTELSYDNYPANVDGNELSLPAAYDSFYAWAKSADNGKVFVKDAFAADLSAAAVDDQVIAQPFAALTGLGTGLALQNATGKVNDYTVIDKPTAVTFTVNFDANIAAATYSIDGADAQAIADGGTIADVAPGSVVTFAVTETTKEGCMVAATATGNVTQDGLAFTVAQDLTNPAVTINLTATQAFALAIPLESGETVKCATPADAWLYATNGTHYVKFLQTIKSSTMVLNVMSGDTALIDLNGCDSLYRAKSGFMTVADVADKPYKAYTAYANLAAAWAAGKSAVKYRFSTTVDASAITLGADGAVLEGEFSINTENKVEGGFKENTEPKLGENYEKTSDWGMIDRAAFKFAAAATSTDPVPPPAEDTPEAVAAALATKGITAADVTSKADLVALNAMLTAAGVTDAATLSEGAKAALNSSFLMKDIAAGKIFEAEPTITIEKIEATETAGTFEFTVAVKEGATLVQLQQAGAEALADKVLVGNKVDAISSKVVAKDLTVKSVADGKAVFDIAYGDGAAGFMKIKVTK